MRVIWGAASLLVVLALVSVLAKKQLAAVAEPSPGHTASGLAVPAGVSVKEQSDQRQQQVRQLVESAMQPRSMPDEPK